MNVTVIHVAAPRSMMSTVREGVGLNEEGDVVRFAGDWRAMRDLAEIVESGEDVEVELEGWQILSVVHTAKTMRANADMLEHPDHRTHIWFTYDEVLVLSCLCGADLWKSSTGSLGVHRAARLTFDHIKEATS